MSSPHHVTTESKPVRLLLIAAAAFILGLFLLLPLVAVFAEALRRGWELFLASLKEEEAWSAVKLTLMAAGLSVPLNTLFGLSAAWLVTKFRFRGRAFLLSLIDLPFAVSPVIAGLVWVLLFGAHGWFGPWLAEHDIRIIFALPGIVIATVFVTFPFVARELIPLMESQGADQEEAAATLGSTWWQTFWKITLPSIRWGLTYGIVLTVARTLGEYGAVIMVSSNLPGTSQTLTLLVSDRYNRGAEYGAYAIATLLMMVAVLVLIVQVVLDARRRRAAG